MTPELKCRLGQLLPVGLQSPMGAQTGGRRILHGARLPEKATFEAGLEGD